MGGNLAPMGKSLADIEVPAETILVLDYDGWVHQWCNDTSVDCEPTIRNKLSESDVARHNEGLNFLFCDGHVKWLKPDRACELSPTTGRYRLWTRVYD